MSYRKKKWLIGSGGILLVEQQKAATNSNEIQWEKNRLPILEYATLNFIDHEKIESFFSPVLVLDSQKSIE